MSIVVNFPHGRAGNRQPFHKRVDALEILSYFFNIFLIAIVQKSE